MTSRPAHMTDAPAEPLLLLAERAAIAYGGATDVPEPVSEGPGQSFRCELTDGNLVTLRLHDEHQEDPEAVEEELLICESLADASLPTPWPLRNTSDALVHDLDDGWWASALQWTPGTALTDVEDNDLDLQTRYHAIGALLADLHLTADAVAPEPTSRLVWDHDELAGRSLVFGDLALDPAYDADVSDMFRTARRIGHERLRALPTEDLGVIHARPLPERFFVTDRGLLLTGFEQCGIGYRLQDLAIAVLSIAATPTWSEAVLALAEGYLTTGGPISARAIEDELTCMIMLCAQREAAFLSTLLAPDSPQLVEVRDRAIRLTEATLNS